MVSSDKHTRLRVSRTVATGTGLLPQYESTTVEPQPDVCAAGDHGRAGGTEAPGQDKHGDGACTGRCSIRGVRARVLDVGRRAGIRFHRRLYDDVCALSRKSAPRLHVPLGTIWNILQILVIAGSTRKFSCLFGIYRT
ncbi:uncharacterized protein LOC127833740 isoform X1 [Dreissena polymorpha]|uniref:uncharacterized protein LOC127833740 isoform X1 n=1 Tax=Dreissena polymorpha TaxID=45954 RepID=UPI0022652BF8|nr:uncharacterized protein LOC127833740 isoform X1 [Dreissena polymorpha]